MGHLRWRGGATVYSGRPTRRAPPSQENDFAGLEWGTDWARRPSMTLTRRDSLRVLGGGAAAAALWPRERLLAYAASKGVKFKVGVTDWNLKLRASPKRSALAKQIGFDGVQVSIGRAPTACLSPTPRCSRPTSPNPSAWDPAGLALPRVLHRNYLKIGSAGPALGRGRDPGGPRHGSRGHPAAVLRQGRAGDASGEGPRGRRAARGRAGRRRRPASSSAWRTRSRPRDNVRIMERANRRPC